MLLAAELSGAARQAVNLTTEFAKTRHQFGAPIGSFQAVQHHLANMYTESELAATLVRTSARCGNVLIESFASGNTLSTGDTASTAGSIPTPHPLSDFVSSAFAAKGFCSEVVPKIIETAIQVHGGIGFTFEHDLHLYLRRAIVGAQLLGSASTNYRALAQPELSAT